MAPKCLSLLLILFLGVLSAEARVSEFFSKAARYDTVDPAKATTNPAKATPVEALPNEQLTPTKVENDPNAFTFTPESSAGGGYGYGLYGHSTQDTNPAGAGGEYYSTNTPAQEFHVGNYEGKGSSHAKEYRDAETKQPEEFEFDDKEFAERYSEKEEYEGRQPATRNPTESFEETYESRQPATRNPTESYDETFENRPREEEPGAGKERARGYDNVEATKEFEGGRFGRRSYTPENYGMSDTRTLENGKYYYDIKNENYRGNPYSSTTKPSYRNERYYGENQNEYQDEAYKGEYQNPRNAGPNGYVP